MLIRIKEFFVFCIILNLVFLQSSREVKQQFFKVDYFKDEIVDIGKDTKIGFGGF